MGDSVGPFAVAGPTYWERGFSPFPLPPKAKYPPPVGYTGYHATRASRADVQAWADNGKGGENIGLHFNDDQLGIDVDNYDDKHGGETLAAREAELGPLPPTFTATSRSDGVSGIRWFTVPPGRVWNTADDLGLPGIDIIHAGWRYAVAPPSIHPKTGEVYVWRDSSWNVVPGPRADEFPALPDAWVKFLDRGSVTDVDAKLDMSSGEISEFLNGLPGGEPCGYLERVLADASRQLGPESTRHDQMIRLVMRIVRAAEQGHAGGVVALDTLESMFLSAFGPNDRRVPPGEWRRAVGGAVRTVQAEPTDPSDRHCCDVRVLSPVAVAESASEFWTARPVLAHIHQFAHSRTISPWALLGATMARCAASVPYTVVLPPLVGTVGSLNLFVALCGPSGSGKGSAEAVAEEAINFGRYGEAVHTVTLGSGEGITHQYAKMTKEGLERTNYQVMISVNEADTMTALGARQGSTLMPELRKAWSGERLGFAYADKQKNLAIPKHQYRMGLVMGIQPGRARTLLEDAEGGTPQRFVFLPTLDPTLPDEPPTEPEPVFWNSPIFIGKGGSDYGKCVIGFPESVAKYVRGQHLVKVRTGQAELEGHAALCRMKIAAILAIMDGRTDVDDSDWELSGVVMAVSVATRDQMVTYLIEQNVAKAETRARGKLHEAVIVSEGLERSSVQRVARILGRKLTEDWQTFSAVRRTVTSKDREHVEEALAGLVDSGLVEQETGPLDKPQYRLKA